MLDTVEIAVFNVAPGPEYETPIAYEQLPRSTFRVDDSTSLLHLIRSALDELGRSQSLVPLDPDHFYLAFPRSGEEGQPIRWEAASNSRTTASQ